MTNRERVLQLFLRGEVKRASNSDIATLTGISPHQQVFQITQKLVDQGILNYELRGRERVFYLVSSETSTGDLESIALESQSNIVETMASSPKTQPAMSLDAENNSSQFLSELGFEQVGQWQLKDDKLEWKVSKYINERNFLYAFVAGKRVMYIGKSVQTLGSRMNGYKRPGPSQSTNIANNARIRGLLSKGIAVEIFVFTDKERQTYRGLPINLAAGLKDILIHRLSPPWNGLGASGDND